MAKRLYVGNLSYSVTSEDLQEMFEQFGRVRSAQVLIDRETGRSRGFGFVEMEDDAEADAAIEALDGNDHEGRRLTVNEARAPRAAGRRRRRRYGGGGAAAAMAAAAMAAVAAVWRRRRLLIGGCRCQRADAAGRRPETAGDAHSDCEGCRHE